MKKIAVIVMCVGLLLALAVPLAGAQTDLPSDSDTVQENVRQGGQGQERAQEARERARQRQEMAGAMRELAQQIRQQREEFRELRAEILNLRMSLREILADQPQLDEPAMELIRPHLERVRLLTEELKNTKGGIRGESMGLRLGRLNQDMEAVEEHLNNIIAVQQVRIELMQKIATELQAMILSLVTGL